MPWHHACDGTSESKGASKGILSSSPSKIEPTEDYAIFRWTGAAPNLEKSDVVRIRCDRVVDKRLVRLLGGWKEDLKNASRTLAKTSFAHDQLVAVGWTSAAEQLDEILVAANHYCACSLKCMYIPASEVNMFLKCFLVTF